MNSAAVTNLTSFSFDLIIISMASFRTLVIRGCVCLSSNFMRFWQIRIDLEASDSFFPSVVLSAFWYLPLMGWCVEANGLDRTARFRHPSGRGFCEDFDLPAAGPPYDRSDWSCAHRTRPPTKVVRYKCPILLLKPKLEHCVPNVIIPFVPPCSTLIRKRF